MTNAFKEIGLRIQGLREACDVTREEMAAELEVPVETYAEWEETGSDVPISAIYHLARKFGVEFTEILTGTAAKLNTYHLVRAGEGVEVDRYPGYYFEDLAWRFADKIMQPLLVTLDPSDRRSSSRTAARSSTWCWRAPSSWCGATASSIWARATASTSIRRCRTASAAGATFRPSS